MRTIDPSKLPQPGCGAREAANDKDRASTGQQLDLLGAVPSRKMRAAAARSARAGPGILQALKRTETGYALKQCRRFEASHKGDPLRQVDALIENISIQALTGRRREVGRKTYKAYKDRLRKIVKDLSAVNMRVQNLSQLGKVHVQALVRYWEQQGASVAYVQNLLTTIRRMLTWLGKPDAVPALNLLVVDPKNAARTYTAVRPKTLTAKGIDPQVVFQELDAICKIAGMQLRLMLSFGLRVEETLMLRPQIADKGTYLAVSEGTKGGKYREVPIETPTQVDALNAAKAIASEHPKGLVSLPRRRSLDQAKRRFHYLCAKVGLTKKTLGVTAHGMRHQYANEQFEALTGEKPPVLGGKPVERELARIANKAVSRQMGHERECTTSAYNSSDRVMARVHRQNLKALEAMFKAEPVVKALRAAGITRLQLIGPAADGEQLPPVVSLAWDGAQPSVPHENNGLLTHELVSCLDGRGVVLACIGSPGIAGQPTFEVF
jgi:site-specific recombinase XerC